MLVTGKYCPEHPDGLWHDPETDQWYESREQAPDDDAVRDRLVKQRIFEDSKFIYADREENRRYDTLEAAPPEIRSRLEPIELVKGYDRCPLDGSPLVQSDADLSDLRGVQDWYLRYELTAVEGVSEIAALGGFVKQYQIVVDPVRLLAYGIPLQRVKRAVQRSNLDVGGRVIEMSETEYMVRGLGYLGTLSDAEIEAARQAGQSIENLRTERSLHELGIVALAADQEGKPIYLSDVAEIRVGPEIRRGIADWDGEGEAVGGVVVMRFGENARKTIERVREKLDELEDGLPPGVAIEVGYDRSDLIDRAVETLIHTLIEEIVIVSIIVAVFLVHIRSALVAILVLPLGVLSALTLMRLMGIDANIMSMGGIAISIGVMVDSSIIMVENAHKHIEHEKEHVAAGGAPTPRSRLIAEASKEVGPSLFFALLIITVSFLPVFALGAESGRLFKPLAFTKTFAMMSGAILAVTMIPVLMVYFISERTLPETMPRSRRLAFYALGIIAPTALFAWAPVEALAPYRWLLAIGWFAVASIVLLPQRFSNEERNPLNRFLHWLYEPFFALVMRFRWLTLLAALLLVAVSVWPLKHLGSEFMPPLEEGDLLYMPTVDPGISTTKARELLQQTNRLIMQFPEVEHVWGKIGRSETATDPAPLTMIETVLTLRRDKSKWRTKPVARFYSNWPEWTHDVFGWAFPASRRITVEELTYGYEWPDGTHVPGLNEIVQFPGLTNAWTMPIRTRIDMLSTGIKTPVGIKVMGEDLRTLAEISNQIAQVVKTAEGTGGYTVSAFPEKTVGGNYIDIIIDREEIARYGLNVADVQDVIMTALGGMNVSYTVEGLERYPINIRYPHELRDNLGSLKQTLVGTPSGAQVPLGQLAQLTIHKGPPMIKSENARLTSWVYVDIAGIDVGTYVKNAQRAVAEQVKLPAGYSIIWSGQFEYMQAARARLMVVVPLAFVLIVMLLYLATHSWLRVGIVLLAVPFSLVGAVWLLYFMDYNISLAVMVGMIALAGLDAETGLVMLLYLDNSFERFRKQGRMRNADDLWWAVHEGAVKRIRPKTMTVAAIFAGLLPLLWASGAGADTMRRLAVPMIGGVTTSFILELLIYPVLFFLAKRVAMRKAFHDYRIEHKTPTTAA
ncbi:MAG: efflux RND transporter permease subunit [Phycisphaeraceae bacterium]|nr:efflux RND transporter permease subunit [Phycisphaeraceae bacterium]MCB9848812.1 efflux RND transporter permease subunit [Phycisphaeraceae bacterium]